MTTPTQYPDGRKSPNGRRAPHALSTNFFAKSKRSGDAKSPTLASPTAVMKGPERQGTGLGGVGSSGNGPGYDNRTEPIRIPPSQNESPQWQKKLAPTNTFNSHYRSISRSMNDLGNIFTRGRSPPNREISPRRGGGTLNTLPETRRNGPQESPRSRTIDSGSVPSISVMQHGENIHREIVKKEGWINCIDSNSVKKGAMRDAWKLQHAVISGKYLMLYKPPSNLQIKSFDITSASSSPPRPQSAPATASPTFNVSNLRHKSTSRHPEIVVDEHGVIKGGTVEALCHELMFTEQEEFVRGATWTLPGWTSPETALYLLIELSTLKDLSSRIGKILSLLIESAPGLFLEPSCYNSSRLLVEKGITPHNAALAKNVRGVIESRTAGLQKALEVHSDSEKERGMPPPEPSGSISTFLTIDEFMRVIPEVFASQIHIYHLKYFRAWNPENDLSILLTSPHLPPPTHRNPLIFTASNIHFLGERVFGHVLSGELVGDVKRRAAVLSQWLVVAGLLKVKGDMVGYLAIFMAILSPAILRLRETWSTIDSSLIEDLLENGKKEIKRLERRRLCDEHETSDEGCVIIPEGLGQEIPAAQGIPFFGDLCHCMDDAYASRVRNVDYPKFIQGMEMIMRSVRNWKEQWKGSKSVSQPQEEIFQKEMKTYQKCFQSLNSNNQNPPPVNSTAFFDQSLACEPSSTGMYLHSHYHQRLPLSTGANVPLVFTDVLSSFSLFDREDTLAITGTLHKKTPSSGLSSPNFPTGANPTAAQSNQTLHPPNTSGLQPNLRRARSFPPSKIQAQTTGYDELDFTTRERTAGLHSGDNAMLQAIRDVAGVGQQLFYSKDGELVVKTITEEAHSSRPSSVIETTSKRVSIASRARINSNGASPRISVHGDGSIPITPCREAFGLDDVSLAVVPKGGTLERLVDILVLGVEDFSRRMNSSEQNSLSSQSPPETPPVLRMSMEVFTITFFATFRSYCSPIVLIDYLKKRLVGSKSAATISNDESDDVVFPDWTGVDHVSDERIDWGLVAKIHMGILVAVDVWISEFFMDFHSDQSLRDSFMSFLNIAAKEISHWQVLGPEHGFLRGQADQINILWLEIKEKYTKLAFAPALYPLGPTYKTSVQLQIPAPNDIPDIEDFVEKLERKVCQSFRMVKLVDWMIAFETLETQSAEPLGFFVSKVSLMSNDDDEVLQNIFFLLKNLRHGDNSTLLESFPKTLRELCNLHSEMSNWILTQIIGHRLSVERRAQRIATLLKCLSICRKRMSGMDLYENSSTGPRQHVPSFVASAISMAFVRPESRIFTHAWFLAAKMTVGPTSQIENLEQLVPENIEGAHSTKPMTPCAGWVLERLLEIVCYVPNMVVENNRLINFDKRRYVYNFINNFTDISIESSASRGDNPMQHEETVSLRTSHNLDIRALKDQAVRENQIFKMGRAKVFWKLLHQEQEKVRRDSKQRDAIERHQRHQLRAETRRHPGSARPEPDKKSGKRLGVNSIFKAVRPISIALTGGWTPPQSSNRIVSPANLPSLKAVEPGRKPSATINLNTVQSVSCPRSTRENYVWKVKAEHGVSFLFQAVSEQELDDWLRIVAEIRGITASDGTESIYALTIMSQNRTPQPVFGVSLDELCRRDNVKVPTVVEALLNEIETRGLDEVGIYRVPGSVSSIHALRMALDSGEDVRMDDDRWYDINAIAGAFKLFMRELPGQILGPEVLHELRDLTTLLTEEEDRVLAYRDVMLQLPPHRYHFLRRVYIHFDRIASNASINKMHAVNLAIVFGMGLAPNGSSPLGVSPDLGIFQTMVKIWITHVHTIFPEVEDDTESVSVNQADSAEIPLSEPSSPALEHTAEFSHRMSLDEGPPSGASSRAGKCEPGKD